MTKVLATRINMATAHQIERAAHEAGMDKTSFMRILLEKGLRDFEEDRLLKRYKKGEISLGKLADELQITKWDAHALLKEKEISIPYAEEDLRDDISAL